MEWSKEITDRLTNNWDFHLKYFTFCHNISYNASNNHSYTPFELIFAKKCNLPDELTNEITPIYNFESYLKIAKHTLQVAHKAANKAEHYKKITKKKYDRNGKPLEVKNTDEHNFTYEINKKEFSVHKNRTVKCES